MTSAPGLLAQDGTPGGETTAVALPPRLSVPESSIQAIPQQFGWVRGDVRPNAFLEALLDLQARRPQLFMSLSLSGEYSDNFFRTERNREDETQTIASLDAVYRHEKGPSFVSLANSTRVEHRFHADDTQVGFANFSLTAGYKFPRLSLALSENFFRDDDPDIRQDNSLTVRRGRSPFWRNSISPQVQYQLSRRTSGTVAYTNILVRDDEGTNDSTSHIATVGLQHRFSAVVRGGLRYAYSTTNSTDTADERSHMVTADAAYIFGHRTTFLFDNSWLDIDRSAGFSGSRIYTASFGVRQMMSSFVVVEVALGPTVFFPEVGDNRAEVNWQVNLNSTLPFPGRSRTRLLITARQSLNNTSTDVENIGVVLNRLVSVTLTHIASRRLRASLFATYSHIEQLENVGSSNSMQDQVDDVWSAGVSATYVLTQTLSLTAAYRHDRRDSSLEGNNFEENRVTLTLAAGFPVF